MDIVLPGKVYDPSVLPLNVNTSSPPDADGIYPSTAYPMVDDCTYAVCIAVNGVICSRNYHEDPTSVQPSRDFLLGDAYAVGNVQYYCEYTERLSSCIYQPPSSKGLFVNGRALDIGIVQNNTRVTPEAVTIIPVTASVRSTRTNIANFDANGQLSFGITNAGEGNGAIAN
ncbi:MAG TPA: hypothetical protein EYO58_03745 [Flavobacteriales bacterium]|nr:hypothetical protein [Flavobacteriales bacterium]